MLSRLVYTVILLWLPNILLAAPVYQNDFVVEATFVGATGGLGGGVGTAIEVATATFGSWTGNYLADRSTAIPTPGVTISLAMLPAHTHISLSFVLGFLESWEGGSGTLSGGPDYLDVIIDGTTVASLTANNASGPADFFAGGHSVG